MKRHLCLILMLFALLFSIDSIHAADRIDPQQEKILSAAEKLFVLMKNKNYPAIWAVLSEKSQKTVIKDVLKENEKANKQNAKANLETDREALRNDFAFGGVNAKAYWNGFLAVFNPEIVLERCKWDMGKIEKDEAEIILQYKTAEKPAILKMFKENNEWKVGLEESFGARRLMPF